MIFTAKQIASFVNGEVVGNENAEIFTLMVMAIAKNGKQKLKDVV